MGTAIKHPMPDRVKPSFVIFDIRTLWRSALSVRVPGCRKLQMTANPVLAHRMLYSCTHMATVDVKGLSITELHYYPLVTVAPGRKLDGSGERDNRAATAGRVWSSCRQVGSCCCCRFTSRWTHHTVYRSQDAPAGSRRRWVTSHGHGKGQASLQRHYELLRTGRPTVFVTTSCEPSWGEWGSHSIGQLEDDLPSQSLDRRKIRTEHNWLSN